MSKSIFIKPALISLTLITLLSSCTQNEASPKPQLENKPEVTQTNENKQEYIITQESAEVVSNNSTSSDVTEAASADSTRPLSIPTTKPQKLNTVPDVAEVIHEGEVQNDGAHDSEQIKKSNDLKISIIDLKSLIQLSKKSEIVIHQQKIIKKSEIKTQILKANEDSYCQVKIQGDILSTDYLKLDMNELNQINTEFDVFESQLSFKNSKATISFNCIHTTSNFYVEDFASNFSKILNVYNLDGEIYDLKNYLNPRTEKRMLNAIKIIDTDKLEQVVLDEKTIEAHALSHGKVDSTDRLSNFIAAGKEKIACMVPEKSGAFDKSKVYIRVEKGIAMETPKNIPVATMYAIYRADEKNYFVLTCLMQKTAEWSELFDAAEGVFKFEALSRLEYNKKFDEVTALHKTLNSKK
jgi:hypothetical protein